MKNIKLLIVANNCPWKSWPDKISEIQAWFSPKVSLAVTFEHTHYQQIPFSQYNNTGFDQAHFQDKSGIDPSWYDTFVSPMARDFDIVLFVVNTTQWPMSTSFRGWRADRTYGAVELQIGVSEYERFKWGDYTGDGFFNLARHEIMHALFMITGQQDTTHFWWDQSPQKLVNALSELEFTEPKESLEITRLQWIVEFLKSLIGIQSSLNKIKMETQTVLETTSPKLPSRKDFCLAIQEYEGYFAPGESPDYPNGTLAWRNKNPGNLRYAKQIGSIGTNRGFAVFPNYETGFAALMRQVEIACTGKSSVFKPEMMLYNPAYISPEKTPKILPGFFQVYAPSTDSNNPDAYASWVAKKIGVNTSFVIKNLA